MLRNRNLYCSILSVSFQAVRLLHTDSPRRGNSALQYLLLLAFKAPQSSVDTHQPHPQTKLDQNGADLLRRQRRHDIAQWAASQYCVEGIARD